MDVAEFIGKWQNVELTERSAAQQHFLDLCEVVDHPKPAAVDKSGESFTFEKGVTKHGGGQGWADVWKKGFFAWEYKGRHRDLAAAYDQLLLYREDLDSPPLLVVSDMDRIIVRTNFTATPTKVHEVRLGDMAEEASARVLRALFHAPEQLRPGVTSEAITARAAGQIAEIAISMRERGLAPFEVARFLDRIVFCLFAEDVGLLREGLFTELVAKTCQDPPRFRFWLEHLFGAMAEGGHYVYDEVRHFDGNLFSDATALEPTAAELDRIHEAAKLDWSAVSPSVFGTLFERGMDPGKRSQLGAHYTSEEDISILIEPVVMVPLRREWGETRTAVDNLLSIGKKKPTDKGRKASRKKALGESGAMVHQFLTRLASVKVLDPACGSGNFLYVTLRRLKDLEKEVILFAESKGLGAFLPLVGPWQLYGIEISPYAYDLAQMTIWIGYLQWTRANGFQISQDPVLKPMEGNFLCRDAILDLTDPDQSREPDWPRVDFVVGNPPFLGGKLLRRELGDGYVDHLFQLWDGRVPREADLCCYWHEKARAHLEQGGCKRAGLLATQGIRGGANRKVLKRIQDTGSIFFAVSDRPWVLDGANVHVAMVGFDMGYEQEHTLNGRVVDAVHPDLSARTNVTAAARLAENSGIAFMGDTKGGAFDMARADAAGLLCAPNPTRQPNSDVMTPWVNGKDVTSRSRDRWIIDFGVGMGETAAARFHEPFEHVRSCVLPARRTNARDSYRRLWWQHIEARPKMRGALAALKRFAVTPRLTKHRLFTWMSFPCLPDCQLIVFARSDDYFFGVLHSRVHELWSRAQGTQLRERESGFRYTPTTCFETFPLPWPPGDEPRDEPTVEAVAAAARELCELRDRWLDPPEWTREETLEFPATAGGPWTDFIVNPITPGKPPLEVREACDAWAWEVASAQRSVELARRHAEAARPIREGEVGVARYPRLAARDAECARKLKERTLTKLYNERPAWLDLAHRKLDSAVYAAFSAATGREWAPDAPDEAVLERLLELNLARAGEE